MPTKTKLRHLDQRGSLNNLVFDLPAPSWNASPLPWCRFRITTSETQNRWFQLGGFGVRNIRFILSKDIWGIDNSWVFLQYIYIYNRHMFLEDISKNSYHFIPASGAFNHVDDLGQPQAVKQLGVLSCFSECICVCIQQKPNLSTSTKNH